MSRHTEASEELFNDFVTTLSTLAQIDSYTIRERHGKAQFLQVDGPRRATLNVRTDAQDGDWWGFTKNVEETLKKEAKKWFLVLLESTPGKGYLLSDVEVPGAKTRWLVPRRDGMMVDLNISSIKQSFVNSGDFRGSSKCGVVSSLACDA